MRFHAKPPAIIRYRDLKGSKLGNARSFVVTLDHVAPPSTLPHELWHVRQFWLLLMVGVALAVGSYIAGAVLAVSSVIWCLPLLIFEKVPALNYRKESAAYAESVRHKRRLDDAARALSKAHGGTINDAKRAIRKRVASEALF